MIHFLYILVVIVVTFKFITTIMVIYDYEYAFCHTVKNKVGIVLCKSVVSEGKELILNWPIRFQEAHGFSFLIGQFDINSSFTDNGLAKHNIAHQKCASWDSYHGNLYQLVHFWCAMSTLFS